MKKGETEDGLTWLVQHYTHSDKAKTVYQSITQSIKWQAESQTYETCVQDLKCKQICYNQHWQSEAFKHARHGCAGPVGYPWAWWWHAWHGWRTGWYPRRAQPDKPRLLPVMSWGRKDKKKDEKLGYKIIIVI